MEPAVLVAAEHFEEGYNCAQAVASPFFQTYGLSPALGLRLTQGFGGGFRMGELCGAASGAVVVIGLGGDSPEQVAEDTAAFLETFQAAEGALTCRELLQATPAQRAAKSPEEKESDREFCTGLVKRAVTLLKEMGY